MKRKIKATDRLSLPLAPSVPSRELSEAERLAYDMLIAQCHDMIIQGARESSWEFIDQALAGLMKFEGQHGIIATTSGFRVVLEGGEA